MNLAFEHITLGQRVLFGTGEAAANLANEVDRLQAQRVMLIAAETERALAATVAAQIKPAVEYNNVVMHVPIEVAQDARRVARDQQADLLVCVGGGSTTGLAKAIAMETRTPIVAVPTT